ncbi:hypothetical protein ACIBKX_20975 [Streptomyces sp. NPDC050658]|uniref:hypothetical protein n=1 Tax=unclassified Streptomyces TaxID=2593676 RepID=UPI00344519E3
MKKTRQRLVTGVAALSLVGIGTLGSAATAQADTRAEKILPAQTALVSPNLGVPGTAKGVSQTDPVSRLLMSDRIDLDPVKVRVPAGTAAEQQRATEQAAKAAAPKWQKKLDGQAKKALSGGDYETYKDYDSDIVFGDCGYSTVELGDETDDLTGFTSGSFFLNKPGYTYSAGIRVWDPDWLDFFDETFNYEGDLEGGVSWGEAEVFEVDEESEYNATLSAIIYTGGLSWCTSGGPQVEDVTIG